MNERKEKKNKNNIMEMHTSCFVDLWTYEGRKKRKEKFIWKNC